MLNNVNIQGRLCAAPELRHTQSGIPVLSGRIAVDRDYLDANGERGTDFLSIVAWRSTAEFVARNFVKGQMMTLNGRLQVRPWEDKEGHKREAVEVVADNVYFAGPKPGTANSAQQGRGRQPEPGPMNEDALPDVA